MASSLMAPYHYVNQCWQNISEVLWHSPEGKFTEMLKIFIRDISLKITDLISQPYLPRTNALMHIFLAAIRELPVWIIILTACTRVYFIICMPYIDWCYLSYI